MEQQTAAWIPCNHCGAKNRVPQERLGQNPRCGRCHEPLAEPGGGGQGQATYLVLRCDHCRTKNRIAADRLEDAAVCGTCSRPLPVREALAPQPMAVGEADFDRKVLGSPLPVLLFAWAPWCSTCTLVAPEIAAFAARMRGKVRVCKADVGTHQGLGARLNILSVPHLFIYDKGEQRESLPGNLDQRQLLAKMSPYLY